MKLLTKDKEYLAERIMNKFGLKRTDAQHTICIFARALENNDQTFFYNLKYTIHFKNDPIFAKKILHCALNTFVYLLTSPEYTKDRHTVIHFYLHFFDVIFIQRCIYAKKLEKRATSAQKMLRHLSEQLNETLHTQELMIANISHEMRTSLNAISGYLTLLEEKKLLHGEEEGFLTKAFHASQTLTHLVSDILDITKINSGQLEIKEEYFWVDELITKTLDSFALELNKKQQISLSLETDTFPYRVFGDRQHIAEIFANLVGNAIKYTDKGKIHLKIERVRKTDRQIELRFCVEDTGIGMTPEQVKYIFNPYSRFKTERKGVGLGLHIASKLAQKLDATINVSSKYGQGSRFEFTVPVTEERTTRLMFKGKKICYYHASSPSKTYKQRTRQLSVAGATLKQFDEETSFVNFLLTDKQYRPDIVSIISGREEYAKFDALINYLKTLPQYANTHFIAEMTGGNISLKHFDKVYDYYALLSDFAPKNSSGKNTPSITGKDHISILVVDDMQTNLEIFYQFVHKRYPDITIHMASGGYEAIGMYKTRAYTMIFLDLKMPGLSGIDVIKKLREIRPLPPTYALTADVYKNTYEQVVSAGFTKLLEKPLQIDTLYKTIEGVMHASRPNQ